MRSSRTAKRVTGLVHLRSVPRHTAANLAQVIPGSRTGGTETSGDLSPSSPWDPEQYLLYASERERPFWDLVSHIPVSSPKRVLDVGCGPGTATAKLLSYWPDATITGIDHSQAMISEAIGRAAPPRLEFSLADARSYKLEPESLDVLLSNSTLQWVPGHMDLFEDWMGSLAPGGALAFQVPGNFSAPSHALLYELAASEPWRQRLSGLLGLQEPHSPQEYHQRLRGLCDGLEVWETTYYQVLRGEDPVLEWVRGSALRPYLAALDAESAEAFRAAYASELKKAYPPEPSGETIFPFRRIFVIARKA